MSIPRVSPRGLACLLLLGGLLLLSACSAQPSPTPEVTMSGRLDSSPVTPGPTPGLQFSLGVGEDQPPAAEQIPVGPAQILSAPETQRILNRLPALEGQGGDVQEFAFPPQSLPAPRPGQTIKESFPPPPAPTPKPETVATGPLEVLRYAPEGEVSLAPNLSLTFNQPMVALTDVSTVNKQVPVKLSPQPEGQWRWVGTKTIVFEPAAKTGFAAGRFPAATRYTVEVAADTMSATGGKLSKTLTFTFSTPPVQVQQAVPRDVSTSRDPLIYVAFDQRVDPAAVLKTVTVAAGSRTVEVRLAKPEEVAADETVRSLSSRAQEGYWLAFKPTTSLPADSAITVTIGPGTPSAEGPLTTTSAYSFSFRTYGPLRIVGSECGWGGECTPFMPWQINFSNPLDQDAFSDTMVVVQPELPARVINIYGQTMQIEGRSAGQTTYTVRVSGNIKDIFGQTLGADQAVTFKVGRARPAFQVPGESFIVLDPYAKPSLSAFTINYQRFSVQAYSVTPADWTAFKTYMQDAYRTDKPPTPPGRLIMNKTVNIEARADELVETSIDLAQAFPGDLGHAIVLIEPQQSGLTSLLPGRNRPQTRIAWVERTAIGLDAAVDANQMVAWANSLADGSPLEGVTLTLSPGGATGKTGADGTARLNLPTGRDAQFLLAERGKDTAILPANIYYWGEEGWRQRGLTDSLAWYVFDDRQMYRPSEEVHVKGWIRRLGAGPRGDVGPLTGAAEYVTYRLRDSQGNQILDGRADLNKLGGFDFAFELTDTMNLGYTYLELNASGGSGGVEFTGFTHTIQVQEFRRPEFEVNTTVSEGPFFVGDSADLEVSANYYAGGALPNADVTWQVTSSRGSYSPPGWDDFTFGRWTPWWYMYREWGPGGEPASQAGQTFTGTTDAAGVHRLRIDFDSVTPPEPSSVTAQATVMDVNRQAWTSSSTLLVHPAKLYVGLRTERLFVEREEPSPVDIIVTDLDGKAVPEVRVLLKAARLEWKYTNGDWSEEEVAVQPCTITSEIEPVRCTFETPEGGTYRITAEITDPDGRKNLTELTRWVSGGKRPVSRNVEQEEATLIPDKKDYQPGDTAEILVQSPFYPAEGQLTLRRSGLLSAQHFTMDGPSTTLRIPIEDAFTPNVQVQVDLVGSAERTGDDAVGGTSAGATAANLPKRPAYATGALMLNVPPLARTLAVEVVPAIEKLEPGGTTDVEVSVTDATGEAVSGAELAFAVVDEAVLALTGYDLPDPLTSFYAQRSPDISDQHSRGYIVLASPENLSTEAMARESLKAEQPAMAEGAAMPAPSATMAPAAAQDSASTANAPEAPITTRIDFNPLANWSPAIPTDATGKARITVKLPDNLTRYRIMVVAVAGGKQFGKGQSALTARLPLMVRPSAPRFLNFGDQFELPIVVQNQTDTPMTVDVAIRTTNARLTDGEGRRVTVPANDRVEVRFPTTTVSAGTARFQIAAVSGKWSDAANISLPVWTPATTEAFAVYGTIDSGSIAQPVIKPTGVYTQFGGLEISTSSTALQALTDAFLYLIEYPFECSEQVSSRILAVAALRDVLTAFKAAGLPSPSEIEAAMARDIDTLRKLQNADGGWPVWTRGYESWPYHSIHSAHALQRAKMKGYDVPADTLDRALAYLRDIEQQYPYWYDDHIRRTLTSYALYTRNLMGDRDSARARTLVNEGLDKLSPEAIGWLLSVLADDAGSTKEVELIRRNLLNRVTETAGAAHFAADYGDQGYVLLYSNRRADGVILDALIGDQPDSDLIPKIVRGLLANRTAGRWSNTQENAFILLALDRYFNTYEAQTPDFVARVWLGDEFAGESRFTGRETDYREIDVPMSYLAEGPSGPQNLILSKDGQGRLYYRLGLRYAPLDLTLPPYDAGFTVERSYEAVDDPGDVKKDAEGNWVIRSGARVRVRITMVAPARRYHVALTDPLPAGLEALNPALAVSGTPPPDTAEDSSKYWWWGPWYSHQNLRDQRAEAFTTLLWEGVHNYSYVARATTPGRFVVPPAKAEEMYMPETFGRSAGDVVIVK